MSKKKKVEEVRRGGYEVSISEPKIDIHSRRLYSFEYLSMSVEEAEEVLEDLRKALCEVPR